MGKSLVHELVYPGFGVPTYQKKIEYGKCLESPNVEDDLWFVTIQRGDKLLTPEVAKEDLERFDPETLRVYKETREPEQHHTFLVEKQYAHPMFFDDWQRDVDEWKKIARKVFVGNWCVRYEVLYKDLPVFEHDFGGGSKIKYAYCETLYDQDYYYVAFNNADLHLIPHQYLNPDFFERMGTDQLKWKLITSGGQFASEGLYDKIKQGNLSPDLANSVEKDPLKDVEKILNLYEEVVSRFERKNKTLAWSSLNGREKVKWIKRLQDSNNKLIEIGTRVN